MGALLVVDVLLVLLFLFNYRRFDLGKSLALPMVSILVAAKDEEQTIERCLDSLLKLSYPKDRLEILVGNDASEDNTLQIIRTYEDKYPQIKSLDITGRVGNQRGKSNVLAQLARQATGEYYMITDADMSLPSAWVQYMLSSLDDKVGMSIGVTHVEGSRMQDIDWLYGLGMLKIATDLGYPMTGMGNNMVISKAAYESVGGYESLPFSVTEDFELFKHVKRQGYQCQHVFQKEVLGKTLPMIGSINLLNQRKRWMKGAAQLPRVMLGLLCMQPGFYIGLLVTAMLSLKFALVFLALKIILRFLLMTGIRLRLNISFRAMSVIIYEFYGVVLTISSAIFYLWPTRVVWKGRKY
jgi:cellulose synthase/poly-beta-1,6-N-acetylglucosamine synthase-like glycosyltransferase